MKHRSTSQRVGVSLFLMVSSAAPAFCGRVLSQGRPTEHDCPSQVDSAIRAVTQVRYFEAEQILANLAREASADEQQARCTGILLNATQLAIGRLAGMAEAESFLRRGIRVLMTFRAADDPLLLRPLQILVSLALESGDVTQADQAFRQMSGISIRTNNDRAILAMTRGSILSSRGKRKEAERDYRETLDLVADDRSESQRLRAGVWNDLAALYIAGRELLEARSALIHAKALTQGETNESERERLMIGVLNNLGMVLYRMRDYCGAEGNLRDAITLKEKRQNLDKGPLTVLLANLEQVLKKQKRKEEAKQIEDRLQALLKDGTQTVNVNALQKQRKTR